MKSFVVLVALLLVTAGSLSIADSPAGAARRDCGVISGSGSAGMALVRVVVLRGVSCRTARRVARAFNQDRTLPRPWKCFLAHPTPAELRRDPTVFSCAYGGRRGNVRKWPHALLGQTPKS